MIVHRQVALAMVAVVGLAVAVYCYAGAAMVSSFTVAQPDATADRTVVMYLWGLALGLVAALVAGIAAWRADRPRRS